MPRGLSKFCGTRLYQVVPEAHYREEEMHLDKHGTTWDEILTGFSSGTCSWQSASRITKFCLAKRPTANSWQPCPFSKMPVDHYIADDYECSEVRLPTHLILTVAESSDNGWTPVLLSLVDKSTWHSLYRIRSYYSRRFVDATVLDPFCSFPVKKKLYRLWQIYHQAMY